MKKEDTKSEKKTTDNKVEENYVYLEFYRGENGCEIFKFRPVAVLSVNKRIIPNYETTYKKGVKISQELIGYSFMLDIETSDVLSNNGLTLRIYANVEFDSKELLDKAYDQVKSQLPIK